MSRLKFKASKTVVGHDVYLTKCHICQDDNVQGDY